eukprot:snap_masked-scaffold337_size202799-processed-gene-1.16 protein:Tk05314 transcript:snap_masked-scaffold337_size202799-processed-gene-1.16-mRNA-1 annotation:"dual specificity protein phosphatase 14"
MGHMRGEQYFHNNPSILTDKLYISAARVISPRLLVDLGITCVINATLELPTMAYNTKDCLQIAVEDRVASKLYIYFDLVADKINSIHNQADGRLLIYCRAGMSRSASLCIAYFIKYHDMSLDEAFAYVKERRPIIHPNVGFLRQLRDYERKLRCLQAGIPYEPPSYYRKHSPLPPLTYAVQDWSDDPVKDYDVQTKVIKPKPKPRQPKVDYTQRLEACAESYETVAVQICQERTSYPRGILSPGPHAGPQVPAGANAEHGMTEPMGTVAIHRTCTPLESLDPREVSSLAHHRRAPFTRLSEPGKIAVSSIQVALMSVANGTTIAIPTTIGSAGCSETSIESSNPMHAFSVFTELLVFLAYAQEIPLECIGLDVSQSVISASPSHAHSIAELIYLDAPHQAHMSVVLSMGWAPQVIELEVLQSTCRLNPTEVDKLLTIPAFPGPWRGASRASLKARAPRRASVKKTVLIRTPMLRLSRAKLSESREDGLRDLCPTIVVPWVGDSLGTDWEHHYRPQLCQAAVECLFSPRFHALFEQPQALETLLHLPPAGSTGSHQVHDYAGACLLAQTELLCEERHVWDDIDWMTAGDMMPSREYPFYKRVTPGDAERMLAKALEEPTTELSWCFPLTKRRASSTVCYLVQKNTNPAPSQSLQGAKVPQVQWANEQYHVDVSFNHHETFPLAQVHSARASPIQDVSLEDAFRLAPEIGHWAQPPLHALALVPRLQFQHYTTFFITNMCIHPLVQVVDQDAHITLEMNNLYCEPTPFCQVASWGYFRSLAHQIASVSEADIRLELQELVCIPDVIGDIRLLKRMILTQGDPNKIDIWLEVFERSVINARPIFALVSIGQAMCRPTVREVFSHGMVLLHEDVQRPWRYCYGSHAIELNYQTQEMCECVPLEMFQDLSDPTSTQGCAMVEAEVSTFEDSKTLMPTWADLLQWEDQLVELDSISNPTAFNLALITFEDPVFEGVSIGQEMVYAVSATLGAIPVPWMERNAFTIVTALMGVAIIEICQVLLQALSIDTFEYVQDLEDSADTLIQEVGCREHADRVQGPVDTFWFFDMSQVPTQTDGMPIPPNLQLFLPDPEMVDRLGQEESISPPPTTTTSPVVGLLWPSAETSRPRSTSRSREEKRVAFQARGGGDPQKPSRDVSAARLSQDRLRSTSRASITPSALVSYQKARRHTSRGLDEDQRVLVNLRASARQSQDLLYHRSFTREASSRTRPSNVRGPAMAPRSGESHNRPDSPSSDLTLRHLLETAQKWVKPSSSHRRERSRSRYRR